MVMEIEGGFGAEVFQGPPAARMPPVEKVLLLEEEVKSQEPEASSGSSIQLGCARQ